MYTRSAPDESAVALYALPADAAPVVVMDFKDEAGLWWSRTNGARASEPAFEHAVRAWCPLRRITLAGVTDKESADPDAVANGPRVTVEDLRRFADSIRDLDDPAVMARAWD